MLRDLISQYLLIPIGKTYSGRKYLKARQYQKYLEHVQYKSLDELQANQNAKLRHMVLYAYENVPYYRELFDKSGIIPSDIKGRDDLKIIPFMTKDILNRNLNKLVSGKVKPEMLKNISTGGTTGTPISFYRDQNEEWMVDGSNWYFWKYCGYEVGMKFARLWGNENDLRESFDLYGKFKGIMNNEIVLNFYDLSETRLRSYMELIRKHKPRYLKGFSSAVYTFMRYLKKNHTDIPLPEGVIITSDKIDDAQRNELNDFFNNNVFNEYGCREFSIIGFECNAHEGIHVSMENMVVEVVEPLDNDGYGEVVITSLTNRGMPFIRYKLGDSSVFVEEKCSCGRNLPLLKSIAGRVADFVVTKSKKLIYGDFFAHLLYGTKGIEHYRVIQEEIGRIVLCIEKNEFFDKQEMISATESLKEMTRGDLELDISIVDKIDMHSSGKRRSVVSSISKDYLP